MLYKHIEDKGPRIKGMHGHSTRRHTTIIASENNEILSLTHFGTKSKKISLVAKRNVPPGHFDFRKPKKKEGISLKI